VHDHEVVYARGFGITSVEDGGLPVTAQTLFRIGSVTKPLTGTAIMRLVDRGVLALDAPVREYLPWFTLSNPDAAERVTLRMLLSHTSGIPHDHQPFGPGDPDALAARIRHEIPRFPLVAPPGTLWSYSNGAIHVLGHILEVVTGTTYEQAMHDLVFAPLDMDRTTFDPAVAMTYPLAQSHDLLDDGSLRVQHRFANHSAHYPSGQALSTVLDLANFARLHLQQGTFRETKLLSPEGVAEMHRTQADLFTVPPSGYGLSFFTSTYKGLRRVAHSGAISTFGASFDLLPEAGTAVILLCNRRSADLAAGALVNEIFDLLLHLPAGTPPSVPVEPARACWPRYVGTYLGSWAGLARIAIEGDSLVLEWNDEHVPLAAFRDDLYAGRRSKQEQPVSVGFVSPAAGETFAPYIMVNSMAARRMDHEPDATGDQAGWEAYAGTYTGLSTLHVHVEEDRLVARPQGPEEGAVCIALGERRFACRYGLIVFAQPTAGVSPSLTLGDELCLTRVAEHSAPSTR